MDIGIISYGRFSFLQQCIESVIQQTKMPYQIYIANCFHPQEPEIEKYLLSLLQNNKIAGVILINGNIYGNAYDLLYQHFLKSDPFCVTDGDFVLPTIDYDCLEYMAHVLKSDPRISHLTIRSSWKTYGTTDEEVLKKTSGTRVLSDVVNEYNLMPHSQFDKIGLLPHNQWTGVHFQVFDRGFYERYLRRHKYFNCDRSICRYAKAKHKRWGVLLDDGIHLGLLNQEYYPEYTVHRRMVYNRGVQDWIFRYLGIRYQVITAKYTMEYIT